MSPHNDIYAYEGFRLDIAEKALRRGDVVISITPKVFETLYLFVRSSGHLIEKNELMLELWGDRIVEESNLTFNIKMLRKALGDDAQNPRFLETVPKRGYRFIANVRRVKQNGTNGFDGSEVSPNSHPAAVNQSREPNIDRRKETGIPVFPIKPAVRGRSRYLFLAAAAVIASIGIYSFFYAENLALV